MPVYANTVTAGQRYYATGYYGTTTTSTVTFNGYSSTYTPSWTPSDYRDPEPCTEEELLDFLKES